MVSQYLCNLLEAVTTLTYPAVAIQSIVVCICDPPQDFNAKGESTRTTRFHFKTKEFDQKSVLKFSNKSPVRKSTTRFQCAQKHARRVIYKLNKFPLQKGTVNDYER